jgi:hypothetical protein
MPPALPCPDGGGGGGVAEPVSNGAAAAAAAAACVWCVLGHAPIRTRPCPATAVTGTAPLPRKLVTAHAPWRTCRRSRVSSARAGSACPPAAELCHHPLHCRGHRPPRTDESQSIAEFDAGGGAGGSHRQRGGRRPLRTCVGRWAAQCWRTEGGRHMSCPTIRRRDAGLPASVASQYFLARTDVT